MNLKLIELDLNSQKVKSSECVLGGNNGKTSFNAGYVQKSQITLSHLFFLR